MPETLISPNFVNEASKLAEQRMSRLIETAHQFSAETFYIKNSKESIQEKVKSEFPQRYELVVQKLHGE